MAESIKAKYAAILGLNEKFTQKELEFAYKNSIRILAKLPNLTKEYFIDQVTLYNTAVSILSENSIVTNMENVFSEKICNRLGITLDEADKIFKKRVSVVKDGEDFNTWLDKKRKNQDLYEGEKESAIRIYSKIPQLLLIRYDRLVRMYELDKEMSNTEITFLSWLESFTKLCVYMINKNNQLVIEEQYAEYLADPSIETSFINYLSNKVLELDLCKQLGISYYEAKHAYDFKVSGITFRQYLEDSLKFRDTLAKIGITKSKFENIYATYLEEGYNDSELDFLVELEQALPYCIDIECGYFVLKRRYESLDKDERPKSFIDWLELEEVSYRLGGYSKILSAIYENEVKKGFTGTKFDLFKILSGIKESDDENQATTKPIKI